MDENQLQAREANTNEGIVYKVLMPEGLSGLLLPDDIFITATALRASSILEVPFSPMNKDQPQLEAREAQSPAGPVYKVKLLGSFYLDGYLEIEYRNNKISYLQCYCSECERFRDKKFY